MINLRYVALGLGPPPSTSEKSQQCDQAMTGMVPRAATVGGGGTDPMAGADEVVARCSFWSQLWSQLASVRQRPAASAGADLYAEADLPFVLRDEVARAGLWIVAGRPFHGDRP